MRPGLCFRRRNLDPGVVLVGWIFFRAESRALPRSILSAHRPPGRNDGTFLISPYIIPAVAGVFFVHLFVNKDRQWLTNAAPAGLADPGIFQFAMLLACLAATDSAPIHLFPVF